MKREKLSNTILVNVVLGIIVLLWLIPVVGIFASSFRDRFDIQTTPWWNVLPHRDWVAYGANIETTSSLTSRFEPR